MSLHFWDWAFWTRDYLLGKSVATLKTEIDLKFMADHAFGPLLSTMPIESPQLFDCQRLAKHGAINALQERVFLKNLSQKLSHKSLRAILVKGGSLAFELYDEPWMRPKTDFDFWVTPVDFSSFVEALGELGFGELPTLQGVHFRKQATFAKRISPEFNLQIDVHQALFERPHLRKLCSFEGVMAKSHQLCNWPGIMVPCDEDHLWIVMQHFLGHHPTELRLIWLVDAILLAKKMGQADWPLSWFGDAGFDRFFFWFDDFLSGSNLPWEPEPMNQAHRFLNDLKAVPWKSKGMYLMESLFPPASFMQAQEQGWLPWLYLKRLFRAVKFLKKPVGPPGPKR